MEFPANNEQWRDIDEYDNYQVSSHGRVRNSKTMKILQPWFKAQHNYLTVSLSKHSKVKKHDVHRLVGFAFVNNPNNHNVIDHIDRNRQNNMFNNLRWTTYSLNNKNKNMQSNNTTGVTGVYYDRSRQRWSARWSDLDGKEKTKQFSVRQFGEDQAKQSAINYRHDMERENGYI
jgi:hypothetical protein